MAFPINDYSIYAIPEFKTYVDTGDMNPVHKIREILTDDTAMNKPESDVNDANFMKAADRIYEERLESRGQLLKNHAWRQ